MAIALVRIGQRVVKFDDFVSACIMRHESHDDRDWFIQVECKNHVKVPAFFGSHLECSAILDRLDLIVSEEPLYQSSEET